MGQHCAKMKVLEGRLEALLAKCDNERQSALNSNEIFSRAPVWAANRTSVFCLSKLFFVAAQPCETGLAQRSRTKLSSTCSAFQRDRCDGRQLRSCLGAHEQEPPHRPLSGSSCTRPPNPEKPTGSHGQ